MTEQAPRILLVDDEPQIRKLLSVALTKSGYNVQAVDSAQQAIARAHLGGLDLMVLDLGLPDMDGIEACRHIRAVSEVPIIVLSVRDREEDKVAALDLGADDYVTKPFSMQEFLARVRAGIRRGSTSTAEISIEVGQLVIDLGARRVLRSGHHIHLTPTEYDLLRTLAIHRGRVITHRQLLREVRGPGYETDTPLLRVHMTALRQKLDIAPGLPGYIATEPGVGYRFLEG